LLLPRFYVYHHETTPGSAEDRAWIERERRVRRIILTPAMITVWVLGLMLAFNVGAFDQGWFHAKLALVVALTAYQGWLGVYGKRLASGKRTASNRTLRIMNEVPGVAAAIIVVLVIVRPF
jgi:protoporphyrinogen IX oxidase